LKENLREFLYKSSLASMNIVFGVHNDSISFSWAGYNHKMNEFIIETINKILIMQSNIQSESKQRDIFDHVKELCLIEN
jgi:hypothetical protein